MGAFSLIVVINLLNRILLTDSISNGDEYCVDWDCGLCAMHSSRWMAYVLETIFTGLIVITFLSLTEKKTGRLCDSESLKVGLVLVVTILILGPLTSGCINPARATGSAMVSKNFQDLWLYWLSGYSGAVLGAVFYCAVPEKDQSENLEKTDASNGAERNTNSSHSSNGIASTRTENGDPASLTPGSSTTQLVTASTYIDTASSLRSSQSPIQIVVDMPPRATRSHTIQHYDLTPTRSNEESGNFPFGGI